MSTEAKTRNPTAGSGRRPRWWFWVAGIVVVVLLAGFLLYRLLPGGDGWKEVWQEDFSGSAGSAPDAGTWLTDVGTSYPGGAAQWGTGEIQTYTADRANSSLDGDGHLKITATRDSAGVWHSARFETKRTDFRPEAGGRLKVAAKIQVPDGGPGYWGAFWMLGAPFRGVYTNWPGIGEIDVMEYKGSEPANVYGTFHCGVAPGGPCDENNGKGSKLASPDGALSGDFHTYAIEWDRSSSPEAIHWSLDGKVYHTVTATDVGAEAWQNATGHGYFVLLNLAMGGSFGGPPDATTRPSRSMLVDDVTVSRR